MTRRDSTLVVAIGLFAVAFAVVFVALFTPPACAIGPDRYDDEIRGASERWLPGVDWVRFRALLYQESRLDPSAVSPVGAEGISQLMPGTRRELAEVFGSGLLRPGHARLEIQAGAYYLAGRIQFWSEPRPYLEQRRLGEACYNAGCGNVHKAQLVCRQAVGACSGQLCRTWSQISEHLSAVTGHHAQETLSYIRHIERWQRRMIAAGIR